MPAELLNTIRRLPVEAVVWTGGLVALACTDPHAEGLLNLCLFKLAGLPACPGCGLGHAVAYLFHGEWTLALKTHPLAPFAVAVLAGRVGLLLGQAYVPRIATKCFNLVSLCRKSSGTCPSWRTTSKCTSPS